MAAAIRQQMLAIGARQALSPVFDLARDPRWGRCEETYGESSLLAARFATSFVRGLQADRLAEAVAATGKHFIAHGLAEGGRNIAPARVGPRELRGKHALPYAAAIHRARLASVMNAYHEIDGVPCGASPALLRGLLRGELGFDGVVVSDYAVIAFLIEHHGVAVGKESAAMLALRAGIDVELPNADCIPALGAAVREGRFPEALVDEAVLRVLDLKQRLGLLAGSYLPDPRRSLDEPPDRELARRIATEAVVLLDNDGVLPLRPGVRTVALSGPGAVDSAYFFGDYHYQSDGASRVWRAGEAAPVSEPHSVPTRCLAEALAEALSPTVRLTVHDGLSDPAEAVAAAAACDVAIVAVGSRSGFGEDRTCGEFHDSATLQLPGDQQQLLLAVLDTGTPTVVILTGGRVFAVGDLPAKAAAVVQAFPLGEEGAAALAAVLTGRAEPAGRLPISIPYHVGQVPVAHDLPATAARSHPYGDYVDAPAAAAYPFGHGRSYTRFRYGGLQVLPNEPTTASQLKVIVEVRNVGGRRGWEVVQVYLRDVTATLVQPGRQLAGYTKILLEPGQARLVEIEPALSALMLINDGLRQVIEPGEFEVLVGSSAADIRLRQTITMTGPVRELSWAQITESLDPSDVPSCS